VIRTQLTLALMVLATLGCAPESSSPFTDADPRSSQDLGQAPDTATDPSDASSVDANLAPDAQTLADASPPADAGAPPQAWCGHQWPPQTDAVLGQPSATLYGRFWLSEAATALPTRFEIGYGPAGSRPDAQWTWSAAAPNADCDCADEREHTAQLTPAQPGQYDLAWRLILGDYAPILCDRRDEGRAGSGDGYSPEQAAHLTVSAVGAITVATANLRCLIDDWPARRPRLVAALAEANPDLIALQEVCSSDEQDNLTELLSALSTATGRTYHVARTTTHRAWDTYHEGLAVISATPIDAQRVLELPSNRLPRAAVMIRTQTALGPLAFASTHLNAEVEEAPARGRQADAIRAALDGWAPGTLRLVAGDFNEGPNGPATGGMVGGGYADLWARAHPDDLGATFPAHAPETRIDYLFVQPAPVVLEVQRFLHAVDGVYPSDHLGIWARIER
jgi:endonuclease/exonuclease/phosphatase family metal-dependent hydrolase